MTSPPSDQFGPAWQSEFLAILSRFDASPSKTTDLGSRLLCLNENRQPGDLLYFHWLYAPIKEEDLELVGHELAATPPSNLLAFLQFTNGANLFANTISLSGMTGRWIERSLELAIDLPISLRYGNQIERVKGQSDDTICIGSMSAGYHSHSPILLFPCGKVVLVTHNDINQTAKEWPSLEDMLLSEANRLSDFFHTDGTPVGKRFDHVLPELEEWESTCAARSLESKREKRLVNRLGNAAKSLWRPN